MSNAIKYIDEKVKVKVKASLSAIAQRAALRKANIALRHISSNSDLATASKHANLMAESQYQTILSVMVCYSQNLKIQRKL